MFTIIVRNNGITHEYKTEVQSDARVLFHALTVTFLHVEAWLGSELVQEYKNSLS